MTTLARAAAYAEAAERESLSSSRAETSVSRSVEKDRAGAITLALESISLSFGGVAALRDVDHRGRPG